jgi:hypothetical protein
VATTSDIYGHLTPEISTEVADVIGAAFDEAYAALASPDATTTRPLRLAWSSNAAETGASPAA